MKHIVRIAPSPSGVMHIGTIRTAYFNWLIAKQHPDGKFIVRIDDTNLSRSQPELIQPIFDTLDWLGLDYDITFNQSHKFDSYLQTKGINIQIILPKVDEVKALERLYVKPRPISFDFIGETSPINF